MDESGFEAFYRESRDGCFRAVIVAVADSIEAEDLLAGVTRDRSQLDESEEMIALIDSGMNVVTWRHAIEDPIQEWGQLLAYLPLVRRRLDGETSTIILLPKPSLSRDQVLKAQALAGEIAAVRKVAFAELRSEARSNMKADLAARRLDHLESLLGG